MCGRHTHTYTCTCRGYISHRRSSLYVNCIRNSEYPANFLHTDHSRIPAKRTSIRRSLHHKFRRTWRCNAHLGKRPRRAFGMHQTSDGALLSSMLRDDSAGRDSRVSRVFVPARVAIYAGYLSSRPTRARDISAESFGNLLIASKAARWLLEFRRARYNSRCDSTNAL